MNLESLELITKLAAKQRIEVAALTSQIVADAKDSKRLFTGAIRQEIYTRDGGKCWYCGKDLEGTYHIDHVYPHTLGGQTVEANGVLSCPSCNRHKGKRVW